VFVFVWSVRRIPIFQRIPFSDEFFGFNNYFLYANLGLGFICWLKKMLIRLWIFFWIIFVVNKLCWPLWQKYRTLVRRGGDKENNIIISIVLKSNMRPLWRCLKNTWMTWILVVNDFVPKNIFYVRFFRVIFWNR
jgi:hypothetical protein